ncbi:3-dehydroshikimate dehydratase [compost metagenome]
MICDAKGEAKPCQPLPNHNQQAPRLLALNDNVLRGEVRGPASSLLRVEVFGNAQAQGTEAEQYLGEVLVNSDAKGQAQFAQVLENADGLRSFTATVTTADGATSELSQPLRR